MSTVYTCFESLAMIRIVGVWDVFSCWTEGRFGWTSMDGRVAPRLAGQCRMSSTYSHHLTSIHQSFQCTWPDAGDSLVSET